MRNRSAESLWEELDRQVGLDEPHPREEFYWRELERGCDELHTGFGGGGFRTSRPSELEEAA